MQLPFGHKGAEATGLPVEEVKKLKAQGKADRDIIVELKKQGHSFESIEKAMLQALRTGGNPSSPQQGMGQQGQMQGQGMAQNQQFQQRSPFNPQQGVFNPQATSGGPGPQQGFSQGNMQRNPQTLETRETLMPQQNMNIQMGGVVPLENEAGNPTDIIEEIVEGVVEEKFEKVDEKFEAMEKGLDKSKEETENLKNLMLSSFQKRDKTLDEAKQTITSMKTEIDDLVIKCNALERAFKQFLPELTEKVRAQGVEKRGVETIEE